ncbi:MAG: type II toxin-antitoxin system RelE/ParE family toxin [Gemmatimonadota bacterium]
MKRALTSTRAAEADLIEIWLYTCEHWSPEQADRYLDELADTIEALRLDPRRGKDRSELRAGYRSWRTGRHLIFYTFTDVELRIQRVLHEVMDAGRHLDG